MNSNKIRNFHFRPKMTERQNRTLRKLFILWLRVSVFKRHAIFKNIAIILLLGINTFFGWKLFSIPKVKQENSINSIKTCYSIENYASIERSSKTASSVFYRLKKSYVNDKSLPDHARYTKSMTVYPDWKNNCIKKLKKIIVLQTRISDIEKSILIIFPDQQEFAEMFFIEKGYDEALSDMSNYYSKFLTQEDYSFVIGGFE